MQDVVFIMVAIAFIAGCAAYVRGLDRMVGPDAQTAEPDEVAAT